MSGQVSNPVKGVLQTVDAICLTLEQSNFFLSLFADFASLKVLVNVNQGHDCLQTEEKKVRQKLQSMKYTMLETRKDGTKFTNKALKEAAAELQSISREYDSKQQQLVDEVGFMIAAYDAGAFRINPFN